MKDGGTFVSLHCWTDALTGQIVMSGLPEGLNANTQGLLLHELTRSVSLTREALQYVLGGKYDVKFYSLTAVLEKAPENGTGNATIGRK